MTNLTLNKKLLAEWEESMRVILTKEQRRVILGRFGREPSPYVWSEQDIAEELRKYMEHGIFVRPANDIVVGTVQTESFRPKL